MKKVIYLGICLLPLGLISCDSDDVDDATCDVREEAQQLVVDDAIEDWDADRTSNENCDDVLEAIEEYRDLECTDEDAYSETYNEARVICGVVDVVS